MPVQGNESLAVLAPVDHVWVAAGALRDLVHATRPVTSAGLGYVAVADVDAVLVESGLLLAALAQALVQAGDWLALAHASCGVGHDQGGDVDATVSMATADLKGTAEMVTLTAQVLDAVRQGTAQLTGQPVIAVGSWT